MPNTALTVLLRTAAFVVAFSLCVQAEQRPVRRDLLVAAAASLSGLAPALSKALHDATGVDVRFNFAGSNTLARQIVEGARVDAFISADEAQMDLVEKAGRVVAGSRIDLVGNQLAIIVSGALGSAPVQPSDLSSARIRRVAMGDPAAVPAGVYGRRWLEAVRLWHDVERKVVPLPSSPAVVSAVREGRADAGIVYVTDARPDAHVRIAHAVAFEDAPRIIYPAAAITGGRVQSARDVLAWLRTPAAQRIFEAAGFRPVPPR